MIVSGYYHKKNLGDEAYKEAFYKLLDTTDIQFCSPDDKVNVCGSNAVIFGGGDLINDYFNERWKKNIYLEGYKNPIIGLSLGIPYPDLVQCGYLDMFDHVFVRSKVDLAVVQKRLGSEYTHYLPDLAFSLHVHKQRKHRKPTCGVFVIHLSDAELKVCRELLDSLKEHYTVILFRFDCSGKTGVDDMDTMYALYNSMQDILLDTKEYTPSEMLTKITRLQAAVCYRFHSHIFCTMAGVPFVSMASTRKVLNYLEDSDLLTLSKPKDPLAILNSTTLKATLLALSKHNKFLLDTKQVRNIVFNKTKRERVKKSLDELIEETQILVKVTTGRDIFLHYCNHKTPMQQDDAELTAKIISMKITNSPDSKFVYGTIMNLKEGKHSMRDMFKYIMTEFKELFWDTTKDCINVSFMNQLNDKSQYINGWNYVVESLLNYNTKYGVLTDLFADRTFHWTEDVLKTQGLIPYTGNWVGFFHHTELVDYTDYNAARLFDKKVFLQSLETCRGIFVLSNSLNAWFSKALAKVGSKVPVYTVYHPTRFPPPELYFNWGKFSGELIHIGSWYRNVMTFYLLTTTLTKKALRGAKMANYFPLGAIYFTTRKPVHTKYMNVMCRESSQEHYTNFFLKELTDYISSKEYFKTEFLALQPESEFPEELYITYEKENSFESDYTKFLTNKINKIVKSVDIVDYLCLDEYDRLLTTHVVFLHLYSASAVNTVLECTVRNTPIVVNRLPAVEEILGAGYPLFYDSSDDESVLQKNIQDVLTYTKLLEARDYLAVLDKSRLKLDYFLDKFLSNPVIVNNMS